MSQSLKFTNPDGSFTIPASYWPVTLVFLTVFFGLTLSVAYFASLWTQQTLIAYWSKPGFVLIPYFEHAVFFLGYLFLGVVCFGIPLSILFTKLFPRVAEASDLQLEVRAMRMGEVRGGFFFLTDALMAMGRIPFNLSNVSRVHRVKKEIEKYSADTGVRSGEVYTKEEVSRARSQLPMTRFWSYVTLGVTTVCASVFVLSFAESYLLVSADQITVNRVGSIGEQTISWSAVKRIYFFIEEDEESISPRLVLQTTDDQEIWIWNKFSGHQPSWQDLQDILYFAQQNQVPLEAGSITYDRVLVEEDQQEKLQLLINRSKGR